MNQTVTRRHDESKPLAQAWRCLHWWGLFKLIVIPDDTCFVMFWVILRTASRKGLNGILKNYVVPILTCPTHPMQVWLQHVAAMVEAPGQNEKRSPIRRVQNAWKCSSELAATVSGFSQTLVELGEAIARKSAAMKCEKYIDRCNCVL